MALRRFDIEAGGDHFDFKPETEPKIAFWLGKYPEARKRSAVIPLLWLAQKDNAGWLSEPAMRTVADRLGMPYIRVYEVATFYTMFRMQPVGKHHIQLCGTTPCMLRGSEDLKKVCEARIGPKMFITDDQRLSWEEVECLGACANAPMVQINDYYYEDLTPESFGQILDKLRNGAAVEPGPFVDRINSAPEGGTDVLSDPLLFNGSRARSGSLPNLEPKTDAIEAAPPPKTEPAKAEDKPAEGGSVAVSGERPEVLQIAVSDYDDLKRIKGIGPKNEVALNELGIFTFKQIAGWTPANIEWVEGSLSFPGRIEREGWIEQARMLAVGEETEFSKRVDAGQVPSSKDDA